MRYDNRQLREVFHLQFLARLLKMSDPALYVLKGGVNLRFFFNSPRYSEDMDLDVLGGAVPTLRKNGYKIIESPALKRTLSTFGISDIVTNDPASAKQTGTTQRFRVRLVTSSGEMLPTKVEFSRRSSGGGHEAATISPDIVRPYRQLAFACQHYPGHVAGSQKIDALAHRSVAQARDVFDIYLLHLGGFLDPAQIAIEPATAAAATEQLLSLGYDDYAGQVVEFLEPEVRDQFGRRDQWEIMQQFIFDLLAEAQ